MPLKDKEQRKVAANERIRRYRALHKGVTKQGVTSPETGRYSDEALHELSDAIQTGTVGDVCVITNDEWPPPHSAVQIIRIDPKEELTHLGKTIESMYPSERDIYDRLGIDIRTPVYNRLVAEQKRK